MKKKLSLALVVCLLVSCLMSANAFASFEATVNSEHLGNAVAVELNKEYSYTWPGGYNGEQDYILSKVTVPSNGFLTITAQKPISDSIGKVNLDVSVYNEKNEFVFNNRMENKDEKESTIVGLAAGTYYVVIARQYSYGEGKTSTYKYSFAASNFCELENNETKETATKMVTDTAYTGYLGSGFSNLSSYTEGINEDDRDVYKINLVKGKTYRLKFKPAKDNTTTITEVYTKNEEIGDYIGLKINSDKDFTAPYTGTYYVGVFNYSNGQLKYDLRVDTCTPATKITKLSAGSKAFKVTWKKKSVDGYEIKYSLKKNMSKAKTKVIKNYKTTSAKVKKLKKGKKYYVVVRAYKMYDGKKRYSKWSSKKSIKVK